MSDRGFYRLGGWAALGTAVASLAYAVVAALVSYQGGALESVAAAVSQRGLDVTGWWLFAAMGLMGTLAVASVWQLLVEEWPAGAGVLRWGGGLGLLGAAATAVHGFYEAFETPILVARWETGVPERQAALAAFSGLPNAVDPRGLGSLLFVGFFILVASRPAARLGLIPPWAGTLGRGLAAAMAVTFLLGATMTGSAIGTVARVVLAGLSFGVGAPVWWYVVGRGLLGRSGGGGAVQ